VEVSDLLERLGLFPEFCGKFKDFNSDSRRLCFVMDALFCYSLLYTATSKSLTAAQPAFTKHLMDQR